MEPVLRDAWTSLQKAETLLFRAAAFQDVGRYRELLVQVDQDEGVRALLIRMGNGFDRRRLSAEDYRMRYPFSSIELIQAVLERLVTCGHASANGDGTYALIDWGERAVRNWQQGVGEMMQALDLSDIPAYVVRKLLAYDRRILAAIQKASRPHGNLILAHRLCGLHPEYDPPALWHHWQYVWTMLAASEDEEEHVRKLRGMAPLAWFARRQLWFIHRRPWRARVRNLDDLVRRAAGYGPIHQAEEACMQAIQELKERGWVKVVDGQFWLTDRGLSDCDRDEREIDACFLSCWPALSSAEVVEIIDITARLNGRFEELASQAPRPPVTS
jgi:hypothetical protein